MVGGHHNLRVAALERWKTTGLEKDTLQVVLSHCDTYILVLTQITHTHTHIPMIIIIIIKLLSQALLMTLLFFQ